MRIKRNWIEATGREPEFSLWPSRRSPVCTLKGSRRRMKAMADPIDLQICRLAAKFAKVNRRRPRIADLLRMCESEGIGVRLARTRIDAISQERPKFVSRKARTPAEAKADFAKKVELAFGLIDEGKRFNSPVDLGRELGINSWDPNFKRFRYELVKRFAAEPEKYGANRVFAQSFAARIFNSDVEKIVSAERGRKGMPA